MTRAMRRLVLGGVLGGLLVGAPALHGQAAADSVAHPIATNCGVRMDPVAFVLARKDDLRLSAEEIGSLEQLGQRLAAENRPLGQRFWALAGKGAADQRRPILFELRANYRAALGEIRALLGEARFDAAFQPPPADAEAPGEIRCLSRAIPAVVGIRPGP